MRTTTPDDREPGRRRPQQDRSRDTVARILIAADAEIGEVGLAGASTTSIARRAGISVGGLYRFFGDKAAIADALARAYLDDASEAYAEVLDGLDSPDRLEEVAQRLVDRAALIQLSHPGYYRLTEDLPPDRDDSPAHLVREQLLDRFVAALRSAGFEGEEHRLRLVVALCVETVRHTLVQAPADDDVRSAVVEELRILVTAYLRDRLA